MRKRNPLRPLELIFWSLSRSEQTVTGQIGRRGVAAPPPLPVLTRGCFSERGSRGCGAGGGPGTRPPRPRSSRRARPCALIAPQPAPRGRAERRGPRRALPPPDPPRPRGGGGHCRVPEKFVGPESSLPRPRARQLLRGARRGSESCLKSVTEGGGEKRGEPVGRQGCSSLRGAETRIGRGWGGAEFQNAGQPASGASRLGVRRRGPRFPRMHSFNRTIQEL